MRVRCSDRGLEMGLEAQKGILQTDANRDAYQILSAP